MAMTGNAPLPYKKTTEFPNLAFVDSSDDIRGGMGIKGCWSSRSSCRRAAR